MGRAPCCEKMGLKRGPWTREEDQILINYINLYGHGNWRSLPKQAGLLRCGKSCRLRWANYLRPDIKRGNFSREEEETIIKLHEILGNRWSTIAARLPGRTDNEIKNVWHTHLKKRIKQNQATPLTQQPHSIKMHIEKEPEPMNYSNEVRFGSPQHSSSDISSSATATSAAASACMRADAFDNFPEMDENFWSDVFSADNSGVMGDIPAAAADPLLQQFHTVEHCYGNNSSIHDGMDFWYNLFTTAGELPDFYV